MRTLQLFTTILLTFATVSVEAQHICLTDFMFDEQVKENPELLKTQQNIIANQPQPAIRRATKYTIPVVFHVIHTGGAENISFEQIENQLDLLNKDFSFTNPDKSKIRTIFKGRAIDPQIEFKLAKIDPFGNCTNGVNRIYSSLHVGARNNVKSIPGAYWNSKRYLNIWVVSSIRNTSGQNGTILGFAQFPFTNNPLTDGVVIRSDYVGAIGTGRQSHLGRTLTHEVGHWLMLFHTFQQGCNINGDGCKDTPPVQSAFTNANCNPTSNSCSTDNPNEPDMFENYMDYSRGNCQSMFTANQKSRMHSSLNTYRSLMTSSSNLISTGVEANNNQKPLANFNTSTLTVCVGEPISFYDISCKGPVQTRAWTLDGTVAKISTQKNVITSYNSPGLYPVKLKVSNSFGNSTKAEIKYIKVLPKNAEITAPYIVKFANSDWEATSKLSVPYNKYGTIKRVTDVGLSGNECIKYPVTSANAKVNFQLDLPALDLRKINASELKLSFHVGYAKQSALKNESLKVYYSRDCGMNWVKLMTKTGSGLSAKGSSVINNFKPTVDADWKLLKLRNIKNFANDSNIKFRIEVESDGGNPVYLDDISIGLYYSSINESKTNVGLYIYPNPAKNLININLNKINEPVNLTLLDLQGRVVRNIQRIYPSNGKISHQFSKINNLNGQYILRIKGKDFNIARSILIQK